MSENCFVPMLISDVIQSAKNFCGGIDAFTGKPIEEETTRDKVLYGDADQVCTGIVTCIWPTVDVIRRAQELGANLIISHEAIFWNHGDHQEPVASNRAFIAKRDLLDQWGGAVWRCHDWIHSGVPLEKDGSLADGIFYGLAWKLGWLDHRVGYRSKCMDFQVPKTSARDLARLMVERLGLEGTQIVGDPDAAVSRIHIPMHVMGGPADTELANTTDAEDIDALICMEFIDFTTCEYVRDAAQLGQNKCAILIGHFNLEEPGMEYMAAWLPRALGASATHATDGAADAGSALPPISYVPDDDTYHYILA